MCLFCLALRNETVYDFNAWGYILEGHNGEHTGVYPFAELCANSFLP